VAAAPILTALAAHIFLPDEKLKKGGLIGFAIAIIGVALVVFNGTVVLKLSPIGDLLSFGAALCWAVYSVLLRKGVDKYNNLILTRRIMFWGFISGLPIALVKNRVFLSLLLLTGISSFVLFSLGLSAPLLDMFSGTRQANASA